MNAVTKGVRAVYEGMGGSRLRYHWRLRAAQKRVRSEVAETMRAGRPVKVIVGAATTAFEGWIATDRPVLDILEPAHWSAIFSANSIDRVLAEHVFEHLTPEQLQQFLGIARSYLAPGGRIRIAVPDGFHPDPGYIDHVRPGGSGPGADDHKLLYTAERMTATIAAAGYRHELLEYFDATGAFHAREWQATDGMIRRSLRHDRRNTPAQPHAYTSLIVDAWIEGS